MNYNPTEIVTTSELYSMARMLVPSIKRSIIMLLQHHGISIDLIPILDRPIAEQFKWPSLLIAIDGEQRLKTIKTEGDELVIEIEDMGHPYPLHVLGIAEWCSILRLVETVLLKKNSKELRSIGVIKKIKD